MGELHVDVRNTIRDIPDFPKPGILFKDITPVLADPALFDRIIRWMGSHFVPSEVDVIVGIESRGFMFGAPLVRDLTAGFVPARKKGKLPHQTISRDFELEYGAATLELHVDAFENGAGVVIVDDLLATGGTAAATIELVRELGGNVLGVVFLLELGFLEGRKRIDAPVVSLIRY